MTKKLILVIAFLLFGIVTPWAKATACGHEGWYVGGGYTQLLQKSLDKQNLAPGIAATNTVRFDTRFGGSVKIGYDWCQTRYGLETTISYDKQRLNRFEMVHQFGADLNSVIHLIETRSGLDFYLLAGLGVTLLPEGPSNNNSGAIGAAVNLGPGFRYFLDKTRKAALHFEIPVKYTLFFGNNLSARKTAVYGLPIRIGFTIGF